MNSSGRQPSRMPCADRAGAGRARTHLAVRGATKRLAFALVLAGAAALGGGCGLGEIAGPELDSASSPTESQVVAKVPVTEPGQEQKIPLHATEHVVRLSRAEWERTMRDLLRLAAVPGNSINFPPDPAPPDSEFGSEAGELIVLTTHWNAYQRAAEELAELVAKNPTALGKIVPEAAKSGEVGVRIAAFVADFLPRAYRRAVTQAEIDTVIATAEAGVPQVSGDEQPFELRVRLLLTAILQSPKVLYRISFGEPEVKDGRARLSGYEVAQKLSYALWGTMPDDALFANVREGKLATPEGIAEVVREVVLDPRANEAIADFHDKLYLVERYPQINGRPADIFPKYYPEFSADAQEDVRRTVKDLVIDNPGGFKELATSTVAYVNSRLAPIYGLNPATVSQLAGATPDVFVKVATDPAERIGVLMHPGWLAFEGTPRDPSLIKRGAYMAHHVLCVELGAPIPQAGNAKIEAAQPTNRKRVEATTGQCGAGCHTRIINPLGGSLEGFDSLGQVRTHDGSEPVDTTGENHLIGKFDGAVSLFNTAAKSAQVHACYAAHWGAYLNGTSNVDVTQRWLEKAVQKSLAGASVRELIIELIQTDAFLTVSR